jgi:hypothetical protein
MSGLRYVEMSQHQLPEEKTKKHSHRLHLSKDLSWQAMSSPILQNRLHIACIRRNYSSQFNTFMANDFCILRDRRKGQKYFIGPLKDEGKLFISKGVVSHRDIISRPPRSIINTHNGKLFMFLSRKARSLYEYMLRVIYNIFILYGQTLNHNLVNNSILTKTIAVLQEALA